MKKLQSGTVVGQVKRKTLVPFVCYVLFSALLLPPAAMKSYGRSLERYGGLSMNSVLRFFKESNQRIAAIFQTAFFLNSWENLYVETENQRRKLEFQLADMRRKVQETDQLRQILGLSNSIEWRHVNAEIIVRSGSTAQESIAIDVGLDHGIYQDAPVIGFASGKYGLIGKVETVGQQQSTVVSLVNRYYQLGVTAMLQNSRFQGILSGSGRFYRLDFVSRQALNSIRNGDLVVSAGSKESLYPRGIPIGYVNQVEELEYSASLSLMIQPVVELSQVEYVAVLIDGNEDQFGQKDLVVDAVANQGENQAVNRASSQTDNNAGTNQAPNRASSQTDNNAGTNQAANRASSQTDNDTGINQAPNRASSQTDHNTVANQAANRASSQTDNDTGTNQAPHRASSQTDNDTGINQAPNRASSQTDNDTGINQAPNRASSQTDHNTGANQAANRASSQTDNDTGTNQAPNRASNAPRSNLVGREVTNQATNQAGGQVDDQVSNQLVDTESN